MKPRTVIVALEITTAAPAKLLKDKATWARALEQSGCGESSVQQVQMSIAQSPRSSASKKAVRKSSRRS